MNKYKPSAPSRANTGTSIRGKISAPIPIPDDEEFPIRSPGTGIATPLGNEGIDKQLRAPTGIHQTGIAVSDFSELRAPSTQQSYTEGPLQPRHVLQKTLRNSQISQTDGSSIEKPQRKKTTFKSVIGRLFGTKKGRSSASASRSSTQNPNTARVDQHRSDPTALVRNKPEPPSQNRVASLPINEYNRALRSHSPGVNETSFPLQNSPENRNSTLAERRARTRRATTPSRLFEPGAEYIDNGLAPRPASSHARDSRLFTDDTERGVIGCAVTSGSHPNRRSRSLDGLRQAVQVHGNTRRRSDEIRYWRQSHDVDALSPMSSQKAEQDLQVVAQHEHAGIEETEPAEEHVVPQPFNFGPMGEMAGMKITEAASLETRVTRMEKKMHQMEKMICQMQGLSASNIQDTQKAIFSRGISSHQNPADESSVYSLPRHVDRSRAEESEKRSSSYSRPSTKDTQNSSIEFSRPLSTSTTIRGIPSSSPPLPTDKDIKQLSGDRYNKLVSFVTNEQQARLRLENIVDQLQTQLLEQIRIQSSQPSLTTHHPNLQLLQYSHPDPYPTPSPEHLQPAPKSQRAPRSAFEADDSSDDEDENPNDVFRTPSEEISHYDIGPDQDYEMEEDLDETHGKQAVRITSLSQLTLGKGRGGLQSVNF